MLVQFAMAAFAIFGLAALTIDMGLVRLTQAQMQTAADSAALEGLRFRNMSSDGFRSDCVRRAAARDIVSWTFDDDLVPGSGDSRQFGAGPAFEISGGEGTADAFGTIAPIDPDDHVYKPVLQLNQTENAEYGDLVSGRFVYTNPAPPDEENDYIRVHNDFARSPEVGSGMSGLPGCPDDTPDPWPESGVGPLGFSTAEDGTREDSAFLVRLRRTGGSSDLDTIASVSSTGPTLPLLFGRGGLVTGGDPDEGYSVRHQGLTVRATAIAATLPALRVGMPAGSIEGVAPFALSLGYYAGLPTETPAAVAIGSDGAFPGGMFTDPALTTVGLLPPDVPSPATCSEAANEVRAFVPVYDIVGAAARVVGFGRVTFWWTCALPGGAPADFELSRGSQHVAEANATAHLSDGLPADLSPVDAALLMAANRNFTEDGLGLLVPSLVR